MISPDTPPGTPVVCIDASPGRYGGGFLVLGAYYTVKEIAKGLEGDWGVLLGEVPERHVWVMPHGYARMAFRLGRFRYLDLGPELCALEHSTRVWEKERQDA